MAVKLSAAVVVFFRVVEILLLLRIVISYFPLRDGNWLKDFLKTVTEPILGPIRGLISRSSVGKKMMFDFSPILAYVLLGFVEYILLLLIARFIK